MFKALVKEYKWDHFASFVWFSFVFWVPKHGAIQPYTCENPDVALFLPVVASSHPDRSIAAGRKNAA